MDGESDPNTARVSRRGLSQWGVYRSAFSSRTNLRRQRQTHFNQEMSTFQTVPAVPIKAPPVHKNSSTP